MSRIYSAAAASLLLFGLYALAGPSASAQQNPEGLARPSTAKVKDQLLPVKPGDVHLTGGMLGDRFDVNATNRMLKVDENEMLDGFEQRLKPHQDWAGEHVGKWLHAATLTWANTQSPALRAKLDRVAARLIKTQEADGYLGTYQPDHRWTSWDVWVHKYDLLGLLAYYQYTGNRDALDASKRVGDLLVRTFGPGLRDINRAGEHMGMAADSVLEPIALLYRATADEKYLKFARYIVANYDAPGGPAVLASLEKYHSVKKVANAKAYEMTSNFNGLLELYRITGDRRLLNDMQTAWSDIVKNRLYITGSASSYEVFQENNQFPDGMRSNICETCVTVTWEQMNLQLLRLTGDPAYADQVERTVYNHLLAAQKPTGDDWAYYTPLEGHKPYDSFVTCCHSSGPRGVALLPEFAYMISPGDSGIVVNLYNSSRLSTLVPKVGRVTIVQTTAYPLKDSISLVVTPDRQAVKFPLKLRIPAGAGSHFTVAVNGQYQIHPDFSGTQATYFEISRAWHRGDRVTLTLPITSRLVMGDHADEGRVAVVRGPLVLALDAALNPGIGRLNRVALASDDLDKISLASAPGKAAPGSENGSIFSVLATVGDSKTPVKVFLVPYASAGADGKSLFSVWLQRPGRVTAAAGHASLFSGAEYSVSRTGNHDGDIADDDPDSYSVTFNNRRALEDWFAVSRDTPVTIDRVVYMHGKSFHDGGWFDASSGKPRIEVKTTPDGAWVSVAALSSYPATTSTDSAGIQDGQKFECTFAPRQVFAIRVIGTPASGDNPSQNFASCSELQAFSAH